MTRRVGRIQTDGVPEKIQRIARENVVTRKNRYNEDVYVDLNDDAFMRPYGAVSSNMHIILESWDVPAILVEEVDNTGACRDWDGVEHDNLCKAIAANREIFKDADFIKLFAR